MDISHPQYFPQKYFPIFFSNFDFFFVLFCLLLNNDFSMTIYSRNPFANRLFTKIYSHFNFILYFIFLLLFISRTISSLFRVLIYRFFVSMFFKTFSIFFINEQDDLVSFRIIHNVRFQNLEIFLIEYPSLHIYYYLRTHFNAQFFRIHYAFSRKILITHNN